MNVIQQKINFWISSEFFAVGIFAFLGVAIRVGIENAFVDSSTVDDPSTGYGPFKQMFYTQNYLLPNFLGCFIMAIAIVNTQRITKISAPLYKGISTGLCGSITTFSSWINGAVCCLFGTRGTSSMSSILVMLVLEYWLTWSAFTLGYAVTKISVHDSLIYQKLFARSDVKEVREKQSSGLVANQAKPSDIEEAAEPRVSASTRKVNSGVRLSTLQPDIGDPDDDVTFHALTSRISVWREDGVAEVEGADGRLSSYGLSGAPTRPKSAQLRKSQSELRSSELATIKEVDTARAMSTASEARAAQLARNTAANAATELSSRPVPVVPPEPDGCIESALEFFHDNEYAIWAALFTLTAGITWIITASQADVDFYSHGALRKSFLRSVALAPFGAWFRWGVTKFPELKASWPEMNPQTMLANISAVSIECLLLVFAASNTWTYPINQGIMGSCSTVSTFFAEIHTLYYEKGAFVAFR